uniref:RNase H type-1 domain-containing protein n=2 Tax=Aegilops tauschii subsp. strangulata TaxID=200361 RepID=A0A453C062_AEGTS
MGISDPLIIEAFSLRDGVRFAAIRGLSHVIMEVDCLELVMLWKTCHNSRSIVAPILLEIGELSDNFFI